MNKLTLSLSSIADITTFTVAFSPAASAVERKESAFSCFVAADDRGEMDVDTAATKI